MSDFANLTDQQRICLQVKLDGHIEAAILAARAWNIGLSEALLLATSALLREFAAHGLPREKVLEIWETALDPVYPPPPPAELCRVN